MQSRGICRKIAGFTCAALSRHFGLSMMPILSMNGLLACQWWDAHFTTIILMHVVFQEMCDFVGVFFKHVFFKVFLSQFGVVFKSISDTFSFPNGRLHER